jgi:Mce-associated membrane protein
MTIVTPGVDAADFEHVDDVDGTEMIQADEVIDTAPKRALLRRVISRWRQLAVAMALVASAAAASFLYFGPHRADQEIAAATAAVVDAASLGSVALLSYAPGSVEPDLAAAQSHLTGEFLTYYSQFANQIVAPAAKQKDVHATATVVRAAPAEVGVDHAKVLIFLNQTTTSRDNPEPAQTASSVMVGLTKVGPRWLISSFDPL